MRTELAVLTVLALGLGLGCAGRGARRGADERPAALLNGIESLADGELEPYKLERLARLLLGLGRPLRPDERPLARAVARGLLDRLGKKSDWGARQDLLATDLGDALALHALAPERFTDEDVTRFVEEIGRFHEPRDVGAFIDFYAKHGLPRSAAASAAMIRAAGGASPVDGVLRELFRRGFRIDDGTLRSYAEIVASDRFAVDDLLFVIERTEAPEVARKLPAFAERLMAFVHARPAGAPGAEARRRIYHNAVVALRQARERGLETPARVFERYVGSGALRPDLAIDDLAAAHAVFERPAEGLLDARLAALRGARATREGLVDLIAVAAHMQEQDHPRAGEALLLLGRVVARPPGLDEPIGARFAGRPYSAAAVRHLALEVERPLRASIRSALYLGALRGLLEEQGEPELAAVLAERHLARK